MNLLHVVTAMSWRGGEQQAAYLISELEKQQLHQTVLCSKGSEMEEWCRMNSISYYSCKKSSSVGLSYSRTIKKLCMKLQIDLCHLHDAHAHTFAIIAAVLFRNDTPLVLSRRVDFPIKSTWASHFKYNHPSIKRIICVSDKIKEITGNGIKEKRKLVTVHSGVDLLKFNNRGELRKELGVETGFFLIGNTSALADHKDYFTFVDVACKVLEKNRDALFLIFGKGPLENEIKEYIRSKELEDRILMMGFRKNISELLPELNLFLMTSKTEGLGTSLIDAFAAEVPVVSTNAGGIPELIEDGETGILCPIQDVDCLTMAVLKIMDNPSLSEKIKRKAGEKAKKFSKEATAQKTLSIYNEILGFKSYD